MQELEKVNETSSITTYRARSCSTFYDLLKHLNLETKYFTVLINGERADHATVIEKNDEIVIMPKIAGG